jgi:hypothetical protein
MAGLVFMVATVAGLAADGNFSRAIAPDDFKAAGLDQLSPAQLKKLDDLIATFKEGDLAAARRSAEEALAARKISEAQARAAAAEAKAAAAEAKAAKAEVAESKKSSQGFLAKAKVLLVPGTQIEYAVIKTTVVGKFEGWERHTDFHLANGQTWQVINSDERYFTPPEENVGVEISPATLGGYWMNFPAFQKRVRVRLVGEK